MDHGRIEDLLTLAVKGNPVMTGAARLDTKFLLPPGGGSVMDRLALDGRFEVDAARFTKGEIQQKISDLSARAQGHPGEGEHQVASKLQAAFALGHASASFRKIEFEVPGASVLVDGTYGLTSEQMDFHGVFRMQARVSQAFTGWKSVVLKAADPFSPNTARAPRFTCTFQERAIIRSSAWIYSVRGASSARADCHLTIPTPRKITIMATNSRRPNGSR